MLRFGPSLVQAEGEKHKLFKAAVSPYPRLIVGIEREPTKFM